MIWGWVAGFFRFWYRFIVGDDWTIAATVVVGLAVVFGLSRLHLQAWWLMPLLVPLILALSLWRARTQRA